MDKIIVPAILFTIWFVYDIKCENKKNENYMARKAEDSYPSLPNISCCRIGLFEMRTIKDWEKEWKIYEMRKKLQNMKKQLEIAKKKRELLKKEAERRKVFEKHLLGFQGGSNILSDFNTNRFWNL